MKTKFYHIVPHIDCEFEDFLKVKKTPLRFEDGNGNPVNEYGYVPYKCDSDGKIEIQLIGRELEIGETFIDEDSDKKVKAARRFFHHDDKYLEMFQQWKAFRLTLLVLSEKYFSKTPEGWHFGNTMLDHGSPNKEETIVLCDKLNCITHALGERAQYDVTDYKPEMVTYPFRDLLFFLCRNVEYPFRPAVAKMIKWKVKKSSDMKTPVVIGNSSMEANYILFKALKANEWKLRDSLTCKNCLHRTKDGFGKSVCNNVGIYGTDESGYFRGQTTFEGRIVYDTNTCENHEPDERKICNDHPMALPVFDAEMMFFECPTQWVCSVKELGTPVEIVIPKRKKDKA